MKRLFSLLAVATLCLTSLFAQSKLSNWTSVLLEQKKQMTSEEFLHNPLGLVKMDNGREMVDCYVHYKDAINEDILAGYGAKLLAKFESINIVTASVPVAALEALSENEMVAYVEVAMPVEPKLERARQLSMADRAIYGYDPLPRQYRGNGVILGVVDQELQYAHPAFWNEEHTRFRIKKVWNQQKNGTPPSGYAYGTEHADSSEIINAKYDVTNSIAESGHATHVMGIAAGADHTLPYYGIAEESDIIYVSCPGTSMTNIPSGISYIFNQAKEMNKPCVINVSMGGWSGPHDGTSTESRAIQSMIGAGRLVCGSAGNEGDAKIHCGMTFSADDTTGRVVYNVSEYLPSYYSTYDPCMVEIWGDTNTHYEVRVVVFNRDSMTDVWASDWCNATPENRNTININDKLSIYESNDLYITGTLVGSVGQFNKRGNVSISLALHSLPERCLFVLEVKATDGTVNFFTSDQIAYFSNGGAKKFGFYNGDTDMTVCEPSGVTKNIITVGAYTSYAKGGYGTVGDKAGFSSMGPTLDGRVKPDISAPGMTLVSAFPDFDALKSDRKYSTEVNGKTYWYAYMQGTSMSSPYAAGTIALWLEADPTLTYDGVIDVFQHSCILDEYTGDASQVPNNSWGWGKINAYYGLLYILGYTQGIEDVTKPTVLGIYENGNSDIFKIGFAKNMNDLTLRVYDMSGRAVYTSAEGDVMAGQEISVDLSNMAPGIYMINVGGENYKVIR